MPTHLLHILVATPFVRIEHIQTDASAWFTAKFVLRIAYVVAAELLNSAKYGSEVLAISFWKDSQHENEPWDLTYMMVNVYVHI